MHSLVSPNGVDTIHRTVIAFEPMTTRPPLEDGPLTREEKEFWVSAYLAAFSTVLRSDCQVIDRSLSGLVRASSEAAWASLEAFRAAAKGQRP